MLYISALLFCVSSVSASPGSNGYVYGGGSVKNGTVQIDSHGQSQFLNNLPQTLTQSMNSGSGASVSINGQASSGVTVNPLDVDGNIQNQAYNGNSQANSNGNAATGTLVNNDNSQSDNTNGLLVDGHSQVTGNGTGVSVNNNANSWVAKYPITTTTPWPYTSTQCLVLPLCINGCYPANCSCVCGIIPPMIEEQAPKLVQGNRRKSLQKNKERTIKNAIRLAGPQRQRSSNGNRMSASAANNARKRT